MALNDSERESESGTNEDNLTNSGSLLENYVQNVRDSFGVENIQYVFSYEVVAFDWGFKE